MTPAHLYVIMNSVFRLAAWRTLLGSSAVGIRAGERKTDWTKPLPPPLGLWALNDAGPSAGALLRHRGPRLEAARVARRAAEGLAKPRSDHFVLARTLQECTRRERRHPDMGFFYAKVRKATRACVTVQA